MIHSAQQPPDPSHGDPCAPAQQPNPPGGECEPLAPAPTPPPLPDPKDCPTECECPQPPAQTSNCLEDMIADETKCIKEAERAQSFREELKALLDKAKAAETEYTQDKYDALLEEWKRQDGRIVELIKKLVCAFPCWRCMIECVVCLMLYEVRELERRLHGRRVPFARTPPACYTHADSLHDLRYWHERNRAARQAVFDRIHGVLKAWETPAATIEKALADNAKIIDDAQNVLAPDAAKLVYDVFFILIPRHLAIAPPRDETNDDTKTRIERQYAELCPCDDGATDDCCGPDVGEASLRERLIGPQPYLIAPEHYFQVVCCLVKERYQPAKEALAKAEAAFEEAENKVQSTAAAIEDKIKSLAESAKPKLLAYKCEPTEDDDEGGAPGQAPAPAGTAP